MGDKLLIVLFMGALKYMSNLLTSKSGSGETGLSPHIFG